MTLPKPKTVDRFFKLEDRTWRKLVALTSDLPQSTWTEPGAAGEWSLKEVFAHIADWMKESRQRIPKMLCNEKLAPARIAEFNRDHAERNRKISLEQACKRLERERRLLLNFLTSLGKEQLLGNKRVYAWAAWATFNHYDEHIPNLTRFRRAVLRRKKRHAK